MSDTDIIEQIKKKFHRGDEVYKTSESSTRTAKSYTMLEWKHSEKHNECSLYYEIPSRTPGNKPNVKHIPVSVFRWAYKKISQGQDVASAECVSKFHPVFGMDSCNFSALGGIFERLECAEHKPGVIVSKY